MKEAPQECPLCGDRMWKVRHRAIYHTDGSQSDWDRFGRHIALDHMNYYHRSNRRDLCPCGARFNTWPEVGKHLAEQDDLLIHLALALIARIGA